MKKKPFGEGEDTTTTTYYYSKVEKTTTLIGEKVSPHNNLLIRKR